MTSIKVKFRTSAVEGKEGKIYFQVIHNRVTRQIKTDYKLFAREWNQQQMAIVTPPEDSPRYPTIARYNEQINLDLLRLSRIVAANNRNLRSFTSEEIVTQFEQQVQGDMLCDFMRKIIIRLIKLRQYRTSEIYKTTLNSFMRFRYGEDLLLTDINSEMMVDYEAYLKSQGIVMNTVSFYMRVLRAVYNRAVDQELTEQRHPFKKVYTGVGRTIKRALTLKDMRRIKELDLSQKPELKLARDMFLFSFYTRGMSFIDMAYLRKSDMRNGVINYRRRKTGQQLYIKWERCMQEIIDRHPSPNSEYLLPIISVKSKDDRRQYRNAMCNINFKLKKIGTMIGVSAPLTQYVARHSWASIAKSRNIPISIISEGMGHDSQSTTQIYLASLDTAVIDKANNSILRLL
ncbi:MAG: site-specific integrase [Rikenellaceae bacterium]